MKHFLHHERAGAKEQILLMGNEYLTIWLQFHHIHALRTLVVTTLAIVEVLLWKHQSGKACPRRAILLVSYKSEQLVSAHNAFGTQLYNVHKKVYK